MYIIFVILGFLLALAGVFMVFMFVGQTQMVGLAFIGVACFVGILARMDQASVQHNALIKAVRGEDAPKSRLDREMDKLVEQASR